MVDYSYLKLVVTAAEAASAVWVLPQSRLAYVSLDLRFEWYYGPDNAFLAPP